MVHFESTFEEKTTLSFLPRTSLLIEVNDGHNDPPCLEHVVVNEDLLALLHELLVELQLELDQVDTLGFEADPLGLGVLAVGARLHAVVHDVHALLVLVVEERARVPEGRALVALDGLFESERRGLFDEVHDVPARNEHVFGPLLGGGNVLVLDRARERRAHLLQVPVRQGLHPAELLDVLGEDLRLVVGLHDHVPVLADLDLRDQQPAALRNLLLRNDDHVFGDARGAAAAG